MSKEPEECTESSSCCETKSSCCGVENLALVYGSLLARVWLGVRALQTGIEKYAGVKTVTKPNEVDGVANTEGIEAAVESAKAYAMSSYKGVPEGMMPMFEKEPLMMKWMLPIYDKVLGPALIILGLTILLGIAYRSSLFVLGLLYVSLTWGLILIKQDEGVSWLGVHMIIIIAGLALAQYNRCSIMKKW
jgi:thiosulfate dehydrogenase [quinone] large subunit